MHVIAIKPSRFISLCRFGGDRFMSTPSSGRSLLKRSGWLGLLSRAAAVIGLELTALLVMLLLARQDIAFEALGLSQMAALFAVITFAMVQGLVLSEYPRGDDHTFLRLGMATFCRTGLPLMVVAAIAKYSVAEIKPSAIFFVCVLYAVGHFGSMILSAQHDGSDASN